MGILKVWGRFVRRSPRPRLAYPIGGDHAHRKSRPKTRRDDRAWTGNHFQEDSLFRLPAKSRAESGRLSHSRKCFGPAWVYSKQCDGRADSFRIRLLTHLRGCASAREELRADIRIGAGVERLVLSFGRVSPFPTGSRRWQPGRRRRSLQRDRSPGTETFLRLFPFRPRRTPGDLRLRRNSFCLPDLFRVRGAAAGEAGACEGLRSFRLHRRGPRSTLIRRSPTQTAHRVCRLDSRRTSVYSMNSAELTTSMGSRLGGVGDARCEENGNQRLAPITWRSRLETSALLLRPLSLPGSMNGGGVCVDALSIGRLMGRWLERPE